MKEAGVGPFLGVPWRQARGFPMTEQVGEEKKETYISSFNREEEVNPE